MHRFVTGKPMAVIVLLAACSAFSSVVTPVFASQYAVRDSLSMTYNPRSSSATTTPPQLSTKVGNSSFPVGTVDSTEPSGESPPSATALPGYQQTYVTDFNGGSLPDGWDVFTGTPGSDPGSLWESSHVVISNGLLQLNTWRDPAYNNMWVSGGLCQCGLPKTYGAYFVRSRMTGPGPTQVELLWPAVGWPPEIDFNETYGGVSDTSATLHFTSLNNEVHRALSIDMTQWHTWGVIWAPTSITYIVDGRIWATMTTASEIPDQPMTLDLTQQTWCSSGFACPTTPQSTQVDWVAEYSQTMSQTATVSPFAANSSRLTSVLKAKIAKLAKEIKAKGDTRIVLVGYSDNEGTHARNLAVSRARAIAVETYLKAQLAALSVTGVTIIATGKGSAGAVASNATSLGRAMNRRVVSWIVLSS